MRTLIPAVILASLTLSSYPSLAEPAANKPVLLAQIPGVELRVEDPDRRYRRERERREWRGERERREWRGERRREGCRTITIQRDDGSIRQVRRCD